MNNTYKLNNYSLNMLLMSCLTKNCIHFLTTKEFVILCNFVKICILNSYKIIVILRGIDFFILQ